MPESPVRELRLAMTVEHYDQVEVGSRVAGPVRVALEVADSVATAQQLVAGGAQALAGPVVTPWSHRNVRVRAPDGMQLTLFTVLDDASS